MCTDRLRDAALDGTPRVKSDPFTDRLRHAALAIVLGATAALPGCADKSNPDAIDQRAVERWNFLISHQAEKAYDYLTPGFRATQTRENYAAAMNNRAVTWSAAKYKDKKCEPPRCKVDIDVTYAMPPGRGVGKPVVSTSTLTETWILTDGAWYFLPRQ